MLAVICRRPIYHITCDHGEACSTGDECLTRLEEEPRDTLMSPSSLPSKISTSPSENVRFLDPGICACQCSGLSRQIASCAKHNLSLRNKVDSRCWGFITQLPPTDWGHTRLARPYLDGPFEKARARMQTLYPEAALSCLTAHGSQVPLPHQPWAGSTLTRAPSALAVPAGFQSWVQETRHKAC